MSEKPDVQAPDERPPSIDHTYDVIPVLVDAAHVTHSPEMFAVLLAERFPFDPARGSRPRASLRLTPTSFVSLVAAMASNWNKWAAANMDADAPRFSITNSPPLDEQGPKGEAST